MGEQTRAAREEVLAARARLSSEVDELGSAARSAVDIPAKVRRNPVRTVGLAAGAGFLVVGGPKRVARAVEWRFFPSRAQKVKGLLPDQLAKAIDSMGEDAAKARAHLESEFEEFLRKRAPQAKDAAKQIGGRQSFWKTYDALIVPFSAMAGKRLIDKLFAADPWRGRDSNVQKADEGRVTPSEDVFRPKP